jgi:hypothetical protein
VAGRLGWEGRRRVWKWLDGSAGREEEGSGVWGRRLLTRIHAVLVKGAYREGVDVPDTGRKMREMVVGVDEVKRTDFNHGVGQVAYYSPNDLESLLP